MQHDGVVCFEAQLQSPRMQRMLAHIVRGRPLLPATAFVEAMLSTLRCVGPLESCTLADVRISAPLLLDDQGVMQCLLFPSTGKLLISSPQSPEHAVAQATLYQPPNPKPKTPLLFTYTLLTNAVTGTVAVESEPHSGAYQLHPARLDACLQLGALNGPLKDLLRVPVGMAAVEAGATLMEDMHAACMGDQEHLHVKAAGWGLHAVELHAMGRHTEGSSGLLTVLIDQAEQPMGDDVGGAPLLEVGTASAFDSAAAVLQVAKQADASCWTGVGMPTMAMLRCLHMEGQQAHSRARAPGPLSLISDAGISGEGLYGQQRLHGLQLQQRSVRLPEPLAGEVHIVVEPPGALSSLVAKPVVTSTTAATNMLRVGAVGINFRDLLNVMVR